MPSDAIASRRNEAKRSAWAGMHHGSAVALAGALGGPSGGPPSALASALTLAKASK